jgi:hypothetical protein
MPAGRIAKLAILIAAGVALQALLRRAGFYDLMAEDADGLHVLIQLIGEIYAVLLAFAIFVIWGQFTDVENSVMKEASALDDLLRFSDYLNPDARSSIRRSIADYVHHILKHEWQALGAGRRDRQAEEVFAGAMSAAIEAGPRNEIEHSIHARLLDLAQEVSKFRDERVSKSLARIPPTLATLVHAISGVLVLAVFVYPFRRWFSGACSFAVLACVLFLADFVLMDTDNPLQGAWNVSPKPFADLNP